jgi:hypothetical protein
LILVDWPFNFLFEDILIFINKISWFISFIFKLL